MKFIKNSLILLLIVVLCGGFTSCNSNQNFFLDEDYLTKEDELTISPYFAYYNNGKLPEKLKEIDPEIYKEGALDDGAFNIYFAVCNNSDWDRKLTEIKVKFITTKDGYEIVEPCEFTLDNETYIAAGQTLIIPCSFEKEFVKLEAKLDNILAKTSLSYEGCVLSEKGAYWSPDAMDIFVNEFKFTDTNAVEGKFTIFNGTGAADYFGTVKINLFTDKGEKVNKEPLIMEIDSTIKGGEELTLRYAICLITLRKRQTKDYLII
ncbi:MAG: hypothetical protein IJD90_02145 [Clostridia bacterium]|nr:hypothetical protein [Clostridia bacterium]